MRQRGEHERPGDRQRRAEREHLGDEHHRRVVDLRHRLHQGDDQADDQPGQQRRAADLHHHQHALAHHCADFTLVHPPRLLPDPIKIVLPVFRSACS
jgi:hypothetical protein